MRRAWTERPRARRGRRTTGSTIASRSRRRTTRPRTRTRRRTPRARSRSPGKHRTTKRNAMARAAAFLVGLAIVAIALATWRVAPGDGVLGADVTLYAIEHKSLDLSRSGPLAQARGLTDGGTVEGRVTVRNPGANTVRVRLR